MAAKEAFSHAGINDPLDDRDGAKAKYFAIDDAASRLINHGEVRL